MLRPGPRTRDHRRRIYEILERGDPSDAVSVAVDRLIVALIILNLAAVALETVPRLGSDYAWLFETVEIISLVAFSVEYALRVWVAVEHTPFQRLSPFVARLRYMVSAPGLIDLVAVVPFWFAFLLPPDLRVILVLRMVRFLKIARYSPAMRSLLDVLYGERRALFGCLVILSGVTMLAAAVMHLVEGRVQPEKFGTIPDAMWWAIVTLGTIGYGDVVPITIGGKVVAAATIFLGLIMIALPVGIIANAFSEEIHRRDFVVTWSMVAKVPLFSGLDAGEIAAIMRLLRAQQFEPGAVIVRRGEPGHSMYFIAAGEVEISLPNESHTRLGAGHFFGEIAVLQRTRRSATVSAVTRTSLLVLDAGDMRALMERDHRIGERLHEMARGRVKHELVTPKGDIITEEIEEPPAQQTP
jgi:voltage-gated potassium channel